MERLSELDEEFIQAVLGKDQEKIQALIDIRAKLSLAAYFELFFEGTEEQARYAYHFLRGREGARDLDRYTAGTPLLEILCKERNRPELLRIFLEDPAFLDRIRWNPQEWMDIFHNHDQTLSGIMRNLRTLLGAVTGYTFPESLQTFKEIVKEYLRQLRLEAAKCSNNTVAAQLEELHRAASKHVECYIGKE